MSWWHDDLSSTFVDESSSRHPHSLGYRYPTDVLDSSVLEAVGSYDGRARLALPALPISRKLEGRRSKRRKAASVPAAYSRDLCSLESLTR